ncbi:MAG: hypothetical protein H6641_20895 [Caldilineaceae bacterium]|nr:hypothetical protein [Caldilineaceae bacterium]
MSISATYDELHRIALAEFAEIVVYADIQRLPTGDPRKLRLFLVDNSFVDVFVSVTGRYSYHWARANIDVSTIYRHDNAPHKAWRFVATFPKHFHNGGEENVTESTISDEPADAIREFCRFIMQTLRDEAR